MRHVLSTWTFGFGAMRQYGEPNAESMAVALLKHPDQLHMLRDDPALMDTAIDELLRFDSPVQLDGRMAVEDMEIGGKRIRPGQRVICLLGAANRDPSVFTNPDTLDITRQEKSHVSFGRGIHTASAPRWPCSKAKSHSPACWRDSSPSACCTSLSTETM